MGHDKDLDNGWPNLDVVCLIVPAYICAGCGRRQRADLNRDMLFLEKNEIHPLAHIAAETSGIPQKLDRYEGLLRNHYPHKWSSVCQAKPDEPTRETIFCDSPKCVLLREQFYKDCTRRMEEEAKPDHTKGERAK